MSDRDEGRVVLDRSHRFLWGRKGRPNGGSGAPQSHRDVPHRGRGHSEKLEYWSRTGVTSSPRDGRAGP